ncbi:DUF6527 family protein [Oceanidesulfovibrio marinus]|uniref:Uncharacterized protein n=1 Tax=Oceanidesulfovibrio marinus TaxID=370038 RepID=A0A6P1ZE58_9BACT|nr:hypothetical protein DQK91_20760 [Oceanidesulfovibrio marinus]
MSFFRRAIRIVGNWFWIRVLPPYELVVVEESLPRSLKRGILYIVQEDGYVEQAAMICPCGCREILHMNMFPDERPCWSLLKHDDGSYSLRPSVWRMKGCRSHFWFRNNRIHWCNNSGPWWNRL